MMKLLLTNDDGIRAPGIRALARQVTEEHEVTLVAPDRERSGVAHGVTYMETMWVEPYEMNGVRAWVTSGTPADCVRWGLARQSKQIDQPDLVLSGINRGRNCGFHIFYSGTVAAALQAAAMGVRAIALSMDYDDIENLQQVAQLATEIVFDQLLEAFDQPRMVLNVNFPPFDELESHEVLWTHHSAVLEPEEFDLETRDGDRHVYRARMGDFVEPESGSDRWALQHGRISVTKLFCNLATP